MSSVIDEQTQALLALVKEQEQERCRELLAKAEQEAKALVAAAHREARRRVRTMVISERAQWRQTMEQIQAQAVQERRQQQMALTTEQLNAGQGLLVAALQACWAEPQGRRQWLAMVVQQAVRSLPKGTWSVAHPQGWAVEEWPQPGEEHQYTAEASISAGVRVGRGGTCVDGTLEALIANRRENDAMFLALLEADGGAP